ncbi:unnamed protein product, partial [Ectocarpus sp. 12 AP-2014]
GIVHAQRGGAGAGTPAGGLVHEPPGAIGGSVFPGAAPAVQSIATGEEGRDLLQATSATNSVRKYRDNFGVRACTRTTLIFSNMIVVFALAGVEKIKKGGFTSFGGF